VAKGVDFGTNQKRICDFLSQKGCKIGPKLLIGSRIILCAFDFGTKIIDLG